MAAQIVIGTVCNAPQLAPVGERESVLDIGGGAAVESQLGRLMVAQAQVFLVDAQGQQPLFAVIFPVGEPIQVGARLAEELAFHLFELAGTEGEVARRDLIAERLAHLADAKRQLAAGGTLDVGKVDENALCGFGAQIAGRGRILGYANGRFEHQVKLADGGKVMLAAHRADNFRMGGNKFIHLVKGHAVHIHVLALLAVGNQLVRTVAALAGAAVHQRVAEVAHMAGGDPGLRVHQDSGIQADVVGAFLHKLFHPCFFDVVFELNAQGAIVPAVGKAAVNFAARVDETTVFAQVDDHVQGLFAVLHFLTPSAWLAATQSDLTGARCAVRPLL